MHCVDSDGNRLLAHYGAVQKYLNAQKVARPISSAAAQKAQSRPANDDILAIPRKCHADIIHKSFSFVSKYD